MNQIICGDQVLIVGGNQGIGLGFVQHFLTHTQNTTVFATYRTLERARALFLLRTTYPDRLHCFCLEITEEEHIVALFNQISQYTDRLHWVINCVGTLHEGILQPEKNLRSLAMPTLLRYFQVNSIGAALLAKHLVPLFKHQARSVLATLSAKVGSIGDNQLGGWYGYRASKAALNMLMHTVAIEYRRTCPHTIVALLHPGTTDTLLSQPFQRQVPPEKLFSVARTVEQLMAVLHGLDLESSGGFYNWDGTPLPW